MFDYLLEIELTTPKFSIKVGDVEEVMISPKITTDSVINSYHRDRVYNSKTSKCQDLDCSEFYTSAVTTGQVAQCGDCLPRRTKTTYTKPFGCAQWNFLSRYLYDTTFTKPPRVSDSTTYDQYITWLTGDPGQAQLKQFLAKSGYWLGLPPCGTASWQCLVDCAGGEVGGCWDSGTHGSGNFGSVYNINGSNYQVYDPVQILLAGLTPNGGSFPLLSGNPLNGLSSSTNDCGRPYTILEDARSCLVGQPKPESCDDETYQPKEGSNPLWENKAIAGDFGGKSILSQGECYLAPTTSVIQNSWALAGSLGGQLDVGRFDDPPLFINQVIENCGACISKLVEQNEGPSCCQVSYGKIVVRDSPIWNGTSWGSGGSTWNNFWDDSIPDGGFRDGNNCADENNPATCSWSSDCDGPETGDFANGIGTIPCNSGFKPTSCGRSEDLVQIGHYEYIECDSPAVIATEPFFIKGCDACDNLDICYTIIQAPQSCTIDLNPYGAAHEISRNQNDESGNTCGLSGLLRKGVAFPVCTAEQKEKYGNYSTTCCTDTSSSLNSVHSGGEFAPCIAQVFGSSKPNYSGWVPPPE